MKSTHQYLNKEGKKRVKIIQNFTYDKEFMPFAIDACLRWMAWGSELVSFFCLFG